MHMLAAHYRSEFLATPQLIRFEYAKGRHAFEPTLLIKGSTLLLKYIVSGVRMQLAFALLGNRLLYAVKVYDDERAGILWSLLEHDKEKAAIAALVDGEACQVFLFNELAVNVAWAALPVSPEPGLQAMIAEAAVGSVSHSALKNDALEVLDRFHTESMSGAGLIVVEVASTSAWNPISNDFITSHATASPINLFGQNEGDQQEQMAVWLTDELHPRGVHHSPQVPKGDGLRELTDILISYEFGTTLLESKALTILARDNLPNRSKLLRNMSDHITKAIKQLRGAVRQLKRGTPVTSKDGILLNIERTNPMHGIVLIPDLELIEDRNAYGLPIIKDFMQDTGGFIHLLDIAELLRVVQGAGMIAARDAETTLMRAFDYLLIERAKRAISAGTLCIEILHRFADE